MEEYLDSEDEGSDTDESSGSWGEEDDVIDEETIRQIESNDPGLVELKINVESHNVNYGRLGAAIGRRHTYLRELIIFGEEFEESPNILREFCHGVANNRSIQSLKICDWNDDVVEGELIFNLLTPFFKSNKNFERLSYDGDRKCLRRLTAALSEFNSLKELTLNGRSSYTKKSGSSSSDNNGSGDRTEMIRALACHSGLRKLDLKKHNTTTVAALSPLLRKPETKIEVLRLRESVINDVDAATLATGLACSPSLKELYLDGNLSPIGWKSIISSFQSTTSLEKVYISVSSSFIGGFDDDALQCLSSTLVINNSIKALSLERILRGQNNIDNTSPGWRAFTVYLQSPHSALKSLHLNHTMINDEAVNSIANVLVNNNKLEELSLNFNCLVNPTAFSALLQSPHSALEKLDLSCNYLTDDTVALLANSLPNNTKLKELLLNGYGGVTSNGWEAFTQVLCNKSSIIDTYNSNHTLEKLTGNEEGAEERLPEDIQALLQINRENNKSQAARLKIIHTHFSKGFTSPPFLDMEQSVLPHAIAWMCRDNGTNVETHDSFYRFVRSMPTLFEVNGGNNNKRKRAKS